MTDYFALAAQIARDAFPVRLVKRREDESMESFDSRLAVHNQGIVERYLEIQREELYAPSHDFADSGTAPTHG